MRRSIRCHLGSRGFWLELAGSSFLMLALALPAHAQSTSSSSEDTTVQATSRRGNLPAAITRGHELFGSSEVETEASKAQSEVTNPSMPVDDCSWTFAGTARAPVKLRTDADATNYTDFNNGQPIELPAFFNLVCPFQSKVPAAVPRSSPIPNVETIKLTLHGFLMAAGFEADHDLHCQIAASPAWNQDQVVVEVPPGPDYCDARKAMWGFVKADMAASNTPLSSTKHVLKNPVEVLVTGLLFFDAPHAGAGGVYCQDNGGRGIQSPPGSGSKVRGLWELHPVLSVTAASNRSKLGHK